MGSGHSHDHEHAPAPPRVRRILVAAVVPFVILTVIAVFALWPENPPPPSNSLVDTEYVNATVTRVEATTCGPTIECRAVEVRLTSGSEEGQTRDLPDMSVSGSVDNLEVGDEIVVARVSSDLTEAVTYSFANYQRAKPLWALALLFAVVVVGVARWRGVAALIGLGLTWLILVQFVIPAILDGQSPLAVAIAGSSLIMFVLLYLAHGINARTSTALIGTLVCLALTGFLAWGFVTLTQLTGLGSEEASFIQAGGVTLNLQGLLLASIIIGSLGVLNDVTVTQAAAVWEIHRADPTQPVRRLYGAGMRIGRDHIASTVDTLALAYAGASLPLLILFTLGDSRLSDVVSGEIVAEEVVRTLVGSIGLVASVPLTTLLAALVVVQGTTAGSAPAGRGDPGAPSEPGTEAGSGGRVDAAREASRRRAPWRRGEPNRPSPGDPGSDTDDTSGSRQRRRAARDDERADTWRPPRRETELWE